MKVKRAAKLGRPTGDHAHQQRAIANTLLRTIGEYGFEKASMRLVAREANCTTGVLAHYFSSKEDLIRHAVNSMFDWIDGRTALAAQRGGIEALELSLGGTDEADPPQFDFWAVWLQVLARARQNRRLAQLVAKRHGQFRAALTQFVKEGQARKQIRTDIAAEVLADHINAVSDGLGLMGPSEPKRLTPERRRELIRITIDFFRPRERQRSTQ